MSKIQNLLEYNNISEVAEVLGMSVDLAYNINSGRARPAMLKAYENLYQLLVLLPEEKLRKRFPLKKTDSQSFDKNLEMINVIDQKIRSRDKKIKNAQRKITILLERMAISKMEIESLMDKRIVFQNVLRRLQKK